MPKRKKGAVRRGRGTMCNICGRNCGKGGALKTHIKGAHDINYGDYKKCFENRRVKKIIDAWDDSIQTSDGNKVITHVLVRRFVRDPSERPPRKTVK
ncbi:MAG: hypothetical protein AB1546_01335 [bacterium]